ncbi:putative aldouronate transport system permease protein [Gracilibacillus ureilyticus]|uniref:Putative aldouronate transport system permease protein n=1 Tax=Gracilibacillus ureilyticus TaxID=531814 RepID=A0A1H9VXB4_9BACI|nr:putative aldouronate transport system permease protein [Gracilibacillus ureilyticus]
MKTNTEENSGLSPRSMLQHEKFSRRFRKQLSFQLFVWLGMSFLLIFSFTPMFGVIMAFKDYNITSGIQGIFTSPWIGLKHFEQLINDYNFPTLVRNTLTLSILKLVFSFPIPIIFAIMLNEVRHSLTKRIVQTASYLPHFISWVVVAGIAHAFFSTETGVVNSLLMSMNIIDQPLAILTNPDSFFGLAVGTAIWKEAGWWTIIFLASIAGIDPGLYEAAEIDGAGRLRRIWHITLPGMKGSIVVVLILSIGSMLGGGLVGSNFEQALLFGNTLNSDTSQIIQTYAFNVGLTQGRFAFAAAVDLVQSVISVILILSSNYISRKVSGAGLY